MKKITLLVALAITSIFAQAQSFSVTYPFTNVTPTSGTIDPTPVPTATGVNFGSFSSIGTNTASSGAGRFSFTGWSIGSVGGAADTLYSGMTGALVDTQYYEVTITPSMFYAMSFDSLTFAVRRSSTGIRSYAIRSSLDGYTSNLANIISPASTILSVQGSNEFFFNSDLSGTAYNGSTIVLSGGGFSNLSGAVTFRFYAWNAEAGTGTFSIDNVKFVGTAIPLTPSIFTQPQDMTVCAGTTAQFSIAATSVGSYQWEENAGSGFVPLTNTGVYSGADTDTLRISNTSGLSGFQYHCVLTNGAGNDTSNFATLTEAFALTPSVTIPATQTICDNVDLAGTATGFNDGTTPSYLWFLVGSATPVGSGQSLFIPAGTIPPSTYFVYCQLTSSLGCVTTATVNSDTLTLVVNPSPVTPVVTQSGNVLSTTSYTSYQWNFGATALGVDSSQVATSTGIYTVTVSNSFGCSATSADYTYVSVGIDNYSSAFSTSIYPNPSNDGVFTIDLANVKGKTTFSVYNVIGNLIATKETSSNGKHLLDLSSQAAGCYFVSIKNDSGTSTHKITITK